MERPEPHRIDSIADTIFRSKLPQDFESSFAIRSMECDYGIDLEIEHFKNDESQKDGIIKIQLKGTKSPKLISNNKVISFSFQLNRGEYLVEQVTIPTVIILVDVTTKIVYWTGIQSNKQFLNAYFQAKANFDDEFTHNPELSKKDRTFTIHFDTSNILPETLDKMIKELKISRDKIAMKIVSEINDFKYKDYIKEFKEFKEIESEEHILRKRLNMVSVEKLDRCLMMSDKIAARKQIDAILNSTESNNETKFYATLRTEQTDINSGLTPEEQIRFYLTQSANLEAIAINLSDEHKFVTKMYKLTADMRKMSWKDYNLYMNWKMHNEAHNDNSTWIELLSLERSETAELFFTYYAEAIRSIDEAIERKYFLILPDIALKIIQSSISMLKRLQREGGDDHALPFLQSLESLVDLGEYILLNTKYNISIDHSLALIAIHNSLLANLTNQSEMDRLKERSLKIAENIKDEQTRKTCLSMLIENTESIDLQSFHWNRNNPDWEGLQKALKSIARSRGINLDLVQGKDSSDLDFTNMDVNIAHMVHTGIMDLNPTRIFKKCKYLVIFLIGGGGVIGQMIQLYTMQDKAIMCYKHVQHQSFAHMSLDIAYESFFEKNCMNCPDCEPLPDGWIFTEQYCIEQKKKMRKASEELNRESLN